MTQFAQNILNTLTGGLAGNLRNVGLLLLALIASVETSGADGPTKKAAVVTQAATLLETNIPELPKWLVNAVLPALVDALVNLLNHTGIFPKA